MEYNRQSQSIDQSSGKDQVQTDRFFFDHYGNMYNNTTNITNGTIGQTTTNIDTSDLNKEATQREVLSKLNTIANKPDPVVNVNPNINVQVQTPAVTVSGDGGQVAAFNKTAPTIEASMGRIKDHFNSLPLISQLRAINPAPAGMQCPLNLDVSMSPFGHSWQLHTDVMCVLFEQMKPVLDGVTKFMFSVSAIMILFMA